jgi:hypothetical protein
MAYYKNPYLRDDSFSNPYSGNPFAKKYQPISEESVAGLENELTGMGVDVPKENTRSMLDRIVDAFSITTYPIINPIKNLTDTDPTNDSVLQSAWEGVKSANPFGEDYTKGEAIFSDVLDNVGWKKTEGFDILSPTTWDANSFAQGLVGFAGDVLLDPTTYGTLGLGSLLKGTGRTLFKNSAREIAEPLFKQGLEELAKDNYKMIDDMLTFKGIKRYEGDTVDVFNKIKRDAKMENKTKGFGIDIPFTNLKHDFISPETIRKIGDKTGIAPVVYTLFDGIARSPLGDALRTFRSPTKLANRTLARNNPIEYAKQIIVTQKLRRLESTYLGIQEATLKNLEDILRPLSEESQTRVRQVMENGDFFSVIQKEIENVNPQLSETEHFTQWSKGLDNTAKELEALKKQLTKVGGLENRIAELDGIANLFKSLSDATKESSWRAGEKIESIFKDFGKLLGDDVVDAQAVAKRLTNPEDVKKLKYSMILSKYKDMSLSQIRDDLMGKGLTNIREMAVAIKLANEKVAKTGGEGIEKYFVDTVFEQQVKRTTLKGDKATGDKARDLKSLYDAYVKNYKNIDEVELLLKDKNAYGDITIADFLQYLDDVKKTNYDKKNVTRIFDNALEVYQIKSKEIMDELEPFKLDGISSIEKDFGKEEITKFQNAFVGYLTRNGVDEFKDLSKLDDYIGFLEIKRNEYIKKGINNSNQTDTVNVTRYKNIENAIYYFKSIRKLSEDYVDKAVTYNKYKDVVDTVGISKESLKDLIKLDGVAKDGDKVVDLVPTNVSDSIKKYNTKEIQKFTEDEAKEISKHYTRVNSDLKKIVTTTDAPFKYTDDQIVKLNKYLDVKSKLGKLTDEEKLLQSYAKDILENGSVYKQIKEDIKNVNFRMADENEIKEFAQTIQNLGNKDIEVLPYTTKAVYNVDGVKVVIDKDFFEKSSMVGIETIERVVKVAKEANIAPEHIEKVLNLIKAHEFKFERTTFEAPISIKPGRKEVKLAPVPNSYEVIYQKLLNAKEQMLQTPGVVISDVDIVFHELGHAISVQPKNKKMFFEPESTGTSEWKTALEQDLNALGQSTNNNLRYAMYNSEDASIESFSDYYAFYMSNPEYVKDRFPKISSLIEKALDNSVAKLPQEIDNPIGLSNNLTDAQRELIKKKYIEPNIKEKKRVEKTLKRISEGIDNNTLPLEQVEKQLAEALNLQADKVQSYKELFPDTPPYEITNKQYEGILEMNRDAIRVKYPKITEEELDIAFMLKQQLYDIGKIEGIDGIDELIRAYVPHISTMARREVGDNVKIPDYANKFLLERKYKGTIDQINKKMEGISDKFFETSLSKIMLKRNMKHNQFRFKKQFYDTVVSNFGTKIDNSTQIGANQKVYASIEDVRQSIKSFVDDENFEAFVKNIGLDGDLINDFRPMIELSTAQFEAIKRMNNDFSGVLLPDGIKNEINNMGKIAIQEKTNGMLNLYDKFLSLWKINATAVNQGFHVRNFVSNQFNNYLNIGLKTLDPKINYYAMLMLNNSEKSLKALEETMIEIPGIGSVSLKEVKDQFDALGIGDLNTGTTEALQGASKQNVGKLEGFVEDNFYKDISKGAKSGGIDKNSLNPFSPVFDANRPLASLLETPQQMRKANPGGKDFVAYRVGRKVGQNVETHAKLVNFIGNLMLGRNYLEAGDNTIKYLFDYSDLADFEKDVLKRIVPFYTWIRKNMPLQLESLLTNPKPYRRYGQIKANIESTVTEEDRVDNRYKNPFGRDWIQVPGKTEYVDKKGKTQYKQKFINPSLPLQDLAKLPTSGSDLGKTLLSSANPLIKLGIEIPSNKNTFFDTPITQGLTDTRKAPGYIQRLAGVKEGEEPIQMNPVDRYILQTVTPSLENIGKLIDPTIDNEDLVNNYAKVLGGVGAYNYNSEAYKKFVLKERTRILKDLKNKKQNEAEY